MKTLTVSAALIRGAQACQATKDARYYLNGFLLAANGDVVGANGHILFKGIVSAGSDRPDVDTIIEISGKIPANASTVAFTFSDAERGICTTDNGKAFPFSVLDAKYADYRRVIPERLRAEHSDGFSVQAQYLASVMAVFGKNASVNVYPGAHNDSIRLEYACAGDSPHALEGAVMVIMPVRTGGYFRPLCVPVPVSSAA